MASDVEDMIIEEELPLTPLPAGYSKFMSGYTRDIQKVIADVFVSI